MKNETVTLSFIFYFGFLLFLTRKKLMSKNQPSEQVGGTRSNLGPRFASEWLQPLDQIFNSESF
ncbi:hypothetical protein Hanom_Chr06g00520601 [Helianthus anomalus]